MNALAQATHDVLRQIGVAGQDVIAMALDTTGSSVVIVDARLEPLDEYCLWCDHRAHREAQEITSKAHAMHLEAIE
jgi:L-ribulokinase